MLRANATLLIAAGALTLAACQPRGPALGEALPGGGLATAAMVNASGQPVGRATAREVGGGVRFTLDVSGMPPGQHGAHVHTVGRCDAPGFESAGGHWNPTGAKHGTNNPQGPHLGDLPNVVIGSDGRGTLAFVMPGATLAGVLDADGGSMMVHASADDLVTDPSGNSGGRIACGVFQPS